MPLRKVTELIMSLYGFGYGVFIYVFAVSGINVLLWTQFNIQESVMIGLSFMGFGLFHAFSVWLNGRFFFSPLMRVIGMIGHLLVMFYALINGTVSTGISTAVYAYGWIALFFSIGIIAGLYDFMLNIKKGKPVWMQDLEL